MVVATDARHKLRRAGLAFLVIDALLLPVTTRVPDSCLPPPSSSQSVLDCFGICQLQMARRIAQLLLKYHTVVVAPHDNELENMLTVQAHGSARSETPSRLKIPQKVK